jgi:large subunit ribosomal protein L4
MATLNVFHLQSGLNTSMEVESSLFHQTIKPALVHEAVVYQQAKNRVAIAHTKDRGEVAGTGKKPWAQKGTGRARHGSRRSPIWVGGGITFGPTKERNFSVRMSKTSRRLALGMVLTDKVTQAHFLIVDAWGKMEKTKEWIKAFQVLPCDGKKILVVLDPSQKILARSLRNVEKVTVISVQSMNIVDTLAHEYVVMDVQALEQLIRLYK